MRIKRVGAVFLYVVSFLLIIFYLFTLYEALHPETTREYRNYYITQTARKWGGHSAYEYELGTPILFNSANEETYFRMGEGWSWLEETHCWTDGDSSVLYFESLPERELNLYIKAPNLRSEAYFAKVYVNDAYIGDITPRNGAADGLYCMKMPPERLENGYAEIRIDHFNPQPTEEDYRLLGMLVVEVMIDDC